MITTDRTAWVLLSLVLVSNAAGAAEPNASSTVVSSLYASGACVEFSTSCLSAGAAGSSGVAVSTPAWKVEMQKSQASEAACQDDIEKYCEGIQVGKGRIEKCLKAHRDKLSPKCKAALGINTK